MLNDAVADRVAEEPKLAVPVVAAGLAGHAAGAATSPMPVLQCWRLAPSLPTPDGLHPLAVAGGAGRRQLCSTAAAARAESGSWPFVANYSDLLYSGAVCSLPAVLSLVQDFNG